MNKLVNTITGVRSRVKKYLAIGEEREGYDIVFARLERLESSFVSSRVSTSLTYVPCLRQPSTLDLQYPSVIRIQ